MNLKDIKSINQRIYELDTEINRNSKMMFVATLVFCSLNKKFRDPNKYTEVINFVSSNSPINDMIDLAKCELKNLNIVEKTYNAVCDSLDMISGVSTKLNKNRQGLKSFVFDFINNTLPELSENNYSFFEILYMEIDKKAKNNDKGITLTPYFASQLMIDLAELDYKNDVIADLECGTGLFSLLAYSTMFDQLEKDKAVLTNSEYVMYSKRLLNSIIANDYDAKMVTLCLANFILKNLNTGLLFKEDVFDLNKSDFYYKDNNGKKINLYPTKAILNPPYEDTYHPIGIIRKNIELVKGNNEGLVEKVVAIVPANKFSKNQDDLYKILNMSRLETVIKMQNDLFSESSQSPSTCIFVFNLERAHNKNDLVHYYDFTDSGYVYLKDSGLVDKNKTHLTKKKQLLEKIKANTQEIKTSFVRNWNNFYEVSGDTELITKINPDLVKINKDEADLTFENITIKKMLTEKDNLITKTQGFYNDKDKVFEKYVLNILSEEN